MWNRKKQRKIIIQIIYKCIKKDMPSRELELVKAIYGCMIYIEYEHLSKVNIPLALLYNERSERK